MSLQAKRIKELEHELEGLKKSKIDGEVIYERDN